MNDNDKFKKFFGFGGGSDEQEVVVEGKEATSTEKETAEKAQALAAEWTEKYLSLAADFQNYQKRVSHERTEWAHDSQRLIFVDLLDVIDNFERALELERKRESSEGIEWLAGFDMIYQSIEKLIKKFGVQEITDFKVFNPKYHEALVQVDAPGQKSGQVVDVLKKGYTMHDKVIRPATVSVAK
jgi:molecular chaperone GrpE